MGRRVLSSQSPNRCPAPPSPHLARSGQSGVRRSAPPVFVGIDVATAHLAIALRPTGERGAVTNDELGMAALGTRLQAVQPMLLGLEATGGDHRAVVAALAAAAWPLVVMNPRQVRDCAQATGQLATTDLHRRSCTVRCAAFPCGASIVTTGAPSPISRGRISAWCSSSACGARPALSAPWAPLCHSRGPRVCTVWDIPRVTPPVPLVRLWRPGGRLCQSPR
jgi:hypothetical protein